MDSHGQFNKNLSKKAREIQKWGDRAVGSVLDASKLQDCAFLGPIRNLIIDIENVGEYLKTPLISPRPNVVFRVMSGADDVGDLQRPSRTMQIRGVLNWTGGKMEFFKNGESTDKTLFTVGFPKDKKLIEDHGEKKIPIGKMKHQGVQIFRINQPFVSDHTEQIVKTGLEVIKITEFGENPTAPYLKVIPKTSIISKLASVVGIAFEKTTFQCLYMGSQKVAQIQPIMGIVQNQIGYEVKFSSSLPHPEHQVKAVVLALTAMLLMKLGPVDVEKFCAV